MSKSDNKSTGPKTPEGKAIVSQNAVKHGIYSQKAVVKSPHYNENELEYEQLLASLFTELKPTTAFQESLVRKIATCLWRSQRIIHAETAQINKQLATIDKDLRFKKYLDEIHYGEDADYDGPDQDEIDSLVETKLVPDTNFVMKLMLYEMRLDRQLARSYNLLRQLQLEEKLQSLQNNYNQNKK